MSDTSASQVAVEIVARNNTRDGLAAAAGDVKGAASGIADSFGDATGHAAGFGGALGTLSEKLREHRTEHVQLGGLAMGGGFGLALEGIKEGIGLITHAYKEAGEASETATSQFLASIAAVRAGIVESSDAIQKAIDRVSGMKPSELLQRQADAAKEVAAKHAASAASASSDVEHPRDGESVKAWIKRQAEWEKEGREQLQRDVDAWNARARSKQEEADTVADAERVEAAQKAADKAAAKTEQLNAQFLAKDVAATKWAEDEKLREKADAAKRAAQIIAQQEKQAAADLKFEVAETKRAEDEKERDREEAQKRGDKILAQMAKDAKKQTIEMAADAEKVGSAFGDAFGQMIAGTKSAGAAFAQFGQTIIQMAMQIAIKQVMANAASAAAGAASSQAGIPIIGPVLAIAAMGTMLSAVMGLLGKITSSSGGYEVPSHVSAALGVLHPDETVLTADLSKGLKEMIRNGNAAGGGGDTHHHWTVNTLDAQSFRDFITGRGASGLIQGMNVLQRNGRL